MEVGNEYDGLVETEAAVTPEQANTETTETTTESTTETVDSVADWLTDDLSSRAEMFGMSAEDARSFGDADMLSKVLSSHADALFNRVTSKRDEANPSQSQQEQEATPDEYKPFEFEVDLKAIEAEHGPEVAKIAAQAQAMNDHYKSVVTNLQQQFAQQQKAVQEQVQQVTSFHQEQQYKQEMDTLDNAIKSLPEPVQKMLGSKKSIEVSQQDIQNMVPYQHRDTIYRMAAQVSQSTNGRIPFAAAVEMAARRTFPQLFASAAQRQANETVEQRLRDQKGRFTSPPTNRDTNSGLTPDQIARQKFDAVMDRAGFPA